MRQLNPGELEILKKILEFVGMAFMNDKPYIINIACGGLDEKPNNLIVSISPEGNADLSDQYKQNNKMILDHITGEKRIDIAAKEMIDKIKNGKKKDFSKAEIKFKENGDFTIDF